MAPPQQIPTLPPAEGRTNEDVEAGYVALAGLYADLAVRLIALQAWARRMTGEDKGARVGAGEDSGG